MPDREMVITALKWCIDKPCHTNCPYFSSDDPTQAYCLFNKIMPDALALLREQEARAMTWDELMGCADGDPAFFEERDRSGCWVLIYPTYMCMHDKNGYGERWRYWTSRPTPEQMRDTKWKGEEE